MLIDGIVWKFYIKLSDRIGVEQRKIKLYNSSWIRFLAEIFFVCEIAVYYPLTLLIQ